MKIILTATSPRIDSKVDLRFGRAAYLIVMDPDTQEWQAYPNPSTGSSGGAGTLAAQFIANQRASSVISGDFGPNAYKALQAAGISMYLYGTSAKVNEAIERFKSGRLECLSAPTNQGRHSQG